ncbi:MAG: PAS domain-containing protein [Gammaproteobacteria bacterium]|nr:PAS domain-containing protein [Gammaproteobacteria bacterium]NIM73706.1 PAS domain-containing protein [Gammaproteobacteria bacterium]NIN37380.1 PAS domain-containing protein [Gammaproteobacteria bacterium]NIO25539.1 PAS domain-containing protein [Gammaproteobacteria bacterium]NIO66214.1 PAS domain-containing protein [Gammaproteobacteria bacterium]
MVEAQHSATAGRHRGVDALPAESGWQPLHYFNIYRLVLAGLFLILVVWDETPRPLGETNMALFQAAAILYFVFAIASTIAGSLRRPNFDSQVLVQVYIDIFCIALFMHASGGVRSGFGMLLIVAIAGGSILTQGGVALLFAATASLAVLGQQYYGWATGLFSTASYAHVLMLAAAFFATAYVTYMSAQRIRASEALAAERGVDLANLAQLNEHIIRRMQAGILAIDAEGHIRLMNRSAQQLLGVSRNAAGEQLTKVLRGLAELMQEWRADRSRATHMFQPEGTETKVIASFAAIGAEASDGVLVFLEDASGLSQRAQQLKLAGLGRLAASIAHEIRNPLSAISHAGQLLDESSNLDKADRRLTHMIRDNAERMNAIIEDVLQLGRGKPAEPESVALEKWLDGFLADFITANVGAKDAISVVVEPPNLKVRFDPNQLRQVVWNLCENGLRHSNGRPGLELTAGLGERTRRPYLEVQDHGEGVPVEVEEQIFEPFFTTRVDGTGLGLYLARELCEGNQASLNLIRSEQGTCFRITFSHPSRQDALPT